MNGIYSIIDAAALLVHFIVNHSVFSERNSEEDLTLKAYRYFLLSVGAYILLDGLCAVFIILECDVALNISMPIVYLLMYLNVLLWNNYAVEYLEGSDKVKKVLRYISLVIVLIGIGILVANIFTNTLYRIDDDFRYVVGDCRKAAFILQALLFLLSTIRATGRAFITKGRERVKQMAIAWFAVTLVIACSLQMMFPLVPVYSIGYMVGCCILHCFVIEIEREEQNAREQKYIKKLERLEHMFVSVSGDMYLGILFVDMDDFSTIRVNVASDRFRHKDHGPWAEYFAFLLTNVKEEDREKVETVLGVEALKKLEINKSETVTYRGVSVNEDGRNNHYASTVKLVDLGGMTTAVIFSKSIAKELDAQLEENKALSDEWYRAEIASQSKSSFLFNMSHDIRTPLNAIIGFTDLLEKHQDDPVKRQEYIDNMKNANAMLLEIINNVLELSRIERGENAGILKAWNIESFFESVYFVFREMMENKKITYSKDINVKNKSILCDTTRLREIFVNLISNALKYTETGGAVSLVVNEIPCNKKGYVMLEAKVSDTGIGISEEYSEKIYEEYEREKDDSLTKIEGVGLGLHIVKEYVEAMQGTIHHESEKGKGTTFIVSIPFLIPSDDALTVNIDEDVLQFERSVFAGKRVLIAEDNDLNAGILGDVLEDNGMISVRAQDGIGCIEELEKSQDGFDIILMDVQMPNMDGYEATRRIRGLNDEQKARIPIIALSANAYNKHIDQARRIGMDDYVSKPVKTVVLLNTMGKYL